MIHLIKRILATFAYSAMAVIGSASIIGGIEPWQAALLAGVASCAQVIEKLARAYADDGKITQEELNAAFDVKSKKAPAVRRKED